jgi:hypothetical protein
MSELVVQIPGGAWISGSRHGLMSQSKSVQLTHQKIDMGQLEKMCEPLPMRYGRFSDFTKAGFLSIALCLRDAGALPESCGVVFSTKFEVLASDFDFHRTTLQDGGMYASANLFPYTLPVLAAGEAASHFRLNGPTFSVNDGVAAGQKALQCAALQMADDPQLSMLAGWIDVPPEFEPQRPAGAVFVLISPARSNDDLFQADLENGCLVHTGSRRIVRTLANLFE